VPSLTRSTDHDEQRPDTDRRAGCLDGTSHRMRVVGAVRSGPETRLDCDNPLRAVCREGCGEVAFWRCDSYGCGPCGALKQRRLSRLVDGGASIHLANGLVGYFLTLTAPGTQAHKRWYQGKRPTRRVECDCHDHGLSDGLWNAQESACWNRLRTAMTRDREVIFCGAVETQRRGMLHRHVLVFVSDVMTHEEVQAMATAAGYGCVVDLEPVRSAEKAARYISKYVTKASSDRSVVPWERLDFSTGEITGKRPTYRLWSSSRKWGVTMSEIKATQAAQSRARAMYLRELEVAMSADEGSAPADNTSSDPP
jgi:hypothetical protein